MCWKKATNKKAIEDCCGAEELRKVLGDTDEVDGV